MEGRLLWLWLLWSREGQVILSFLAGAGVFDFLRVPTRIFPGGVQTLTLNGILLTDLALSWKIGFNGAETKICQRSS